MKKRILLSLAALVAGSAVEAQVVTPVWVEHINGLVNVDPANRIPILKKGPGTQNNNGTSDMVSFGQMLRYDATRLLLEVRENGINERDPNITPQQQQLAQQYPDRSLIWIDSGTGRPLGIAFVFGVNPITVTGQGGQFDFYNEWALDENVEGNRALYYGHKNVILRYAPKTGGGWETTPTCAWVEPTTDAKDCANNPLDSSTSGDGNQSIRWRCLRISGAGTSTVIFTDGGTWRAGCQPQIFRTSDGLKFQPVARVDNRNNGADQTSYSLGGLSSHVIKYGNDPTRPNLQTVFCGHYPGTGWTARPDRYMDDPDNPAETLPHTYAANGSTVDVFKIANDTNSVPDEVQNLASFKWEAAGKDGLPINHAVDGVQYYDGNWGGILDANASVDYIVNYSFPSWNNQFGNIKKPGWIGVHRLDGRIASNSAYKLPFYETDIPSSDNSGDNSVGTDWGYDGALNVYPDTAAPANLSKSTVLWVGSAYGFGVFTVQNVAPTIVRQPGDINANEADTITLTAEVSGSPNNYQWMKDGVALDGTKTNLDETLRYPATVVQGVNQAILVITAATPADSGKYHLTVTNPLGNANTVDATVTVASDVAPPTIASVSGGPNRLAVRIVFSEPVDAVTAGDAGNYSLSGGLTVSKAFTFRDARDTVVLQANANLAPNTQYTLTVNRVKDQSAKGNVILPNSQATFKGPVLTQGFVAWEFYPRLLNSVGNPGGGDVADLQGDPNYPNGPMTSGYSTTFSTRPITGGDLNNNPKFGALGDNYGDRVSGWFTVPISGNYTFFIASDDPSQLYFSTDGNPANAALICEETGCCQPFLEPDASQPNWSGQTTLTPISLSQGQTYYLEAIHTEGGGGDWVDVAWRIQGDATPAANLKPIPAGYFSAYGNPDTTDTITITQQPQPVSTVQNTTATFTVQAALTGAGPLAYRWQKNQQDIPGAFGTSYVTGLLSTSDSGGRFRCIISVPGKSVTSDEVLLTVAEAPAAVLTIAVSFQGSNLTISWPTEVTGFVLQSTDRLTSPNWQPVGGVVNNSYVASIGPGNKFFRLIK